MEKYMANSTVSSVTRRKQPSSKSVSLRNKRRKTNRCLTEQQKHEQSAQLWVQRGPFYRALLQANWQGWDDIQGTSPKQSAERKAFFKRFLGFNLVVSWDLIHLCITFQPKERLVFGFPARIFPGKLMEKIRSFVRRSLDQHRLKPTRSSYGVTGLSFSFVQNPNIDGQIHFLNSVCILAYESEQYTDVSASQSSRDLLTSVKANR